MLHITGLCEGSSLVTSKSPSYVEKVSIWWHHHETIVVIQARSPVILIDVAWILIHHKCTGLMKHPHKVIGHLGCLMSIYMMIGINLKKNHVGILKNFFNSNVYFVKKSLYSPSLLIQEWLCLFLENLSKKTEVLMSHHVECIIIIAKWIHSRMACKLLTNISICVGFFLKHKLPCEWGCFITILFMAGNWWS